MTEDRRLIDQCRAAACDAVRSELAPLAEMRGRQSEQIQSLGDGLSRIEKKIDVLTGESHSQMMEWQSYKGRIHALEKTAGQWEIFQTNYEELDKKLDSLSGSVSGLTAARESEMRESALDRKTRASHRWMLLMAVAGSFLTFALELALHFAGVK